MDKIERIDTVFDANKEKLKFDNYCYEPFIDYNNYYTKFNNLENSKYNINTKSNGKHLICDSNINNRMILEKILNNKNCNCDFAFDGYDVIEKIKINGKYDVIWMDLLLSKMNGIDCTKYLRKVLKYNGTINCLTCCCDIITKNDCFKSGMNNIIQKPINVDVLYNLIEKK
jgi:FOG: CheY-like receiver